MTPAFAGRWILVFAASLAAACSEPEPCPTGSTGGMTISSGITPTFTWQTDCQLDQFTVYDLKTGFTLWELKAGGRHIEKPVTYGVVPAGVNEPHRVEPLLAGEEYGVYVELHGGMTGTAGSFRP
jgi:hypothetical protein